MKSDPDKWYVYIRGWEYPCYELYIQDDEVKDGFRTRTTKILLDIICLLRRDNNGITTT